MWIEETYGDLKDNGFDLELSALDHFLRLSRLTLAVLLPYVWFIAVGADVVNRACAPKLTALIAVISLFRIAWDFLQRAPLFDLSFSVVFLPFFWPNA